MGLKDLANLFIRKRSVTIAGEVFDTAETLKGYGAYVLDQSQGMIKGHVIEQHTLGSIKLAKGLIGEIFEPALSKVPLDIVAKVHPDLYKDFTILKNATSLTSPTHLAITNYNLAFI